MVPGCASAYFASQDHTEYIRFFFVWHVGKELALLLSSLFSDGVQSLFAGHSKHIVLLLYVTTYISTAFQQVHYDSKNDHRLSDREQPTQMSPHIYIASENQRQE